MPNGSIRTVWSTTDVAAADAFDYWSDVICEALVRVSARTTGEAPFAGRVEHSDLDGLGLSSLSSGPQDVARTSRLIARDEDDYLLANIQVAGEALVRQDDRAAVLGPGAMTFVDSSRPYALRFSGPFSQLVVQVPRRLVAGAPLSGATAVGLDSSGPGRLVADFLLGLERQHRSEPAAAATLVPHALGLVEAAVGWAAGAGEPGSSAALARERIVRFVRRHAHEPGLDASTVAAACGFSRRTLYRALAEEGESLTALIRRMRVTRARQLLRSRPDRPLAAVARDCGFGGAAQMHRAFRTVTGTTPGAYRHAGAPGQVGDPES